MLPSFHRSLRQFRHRRPFQRFKKFSVMRLNFILTLIAIAICSLIGYAFYSYSPTETKMMFTIGSFLFLSFSGIGLISLSFSQPRTTINIKTVSGIFFFSGLTFNVIGSVFDFRLATYIITLGLLFLLYLLLSYSIAKEKL